LNVTIDSAATPACANSIGVATEGHPYRNACFGSYKELSRRDGDECKCIQAVVRRAERQIEGTIERASERLGEALTFD